MDWHVYIVQCSDGTLYTGVTNNLDKRLLEHNNSEKGAKYTKSRRPVTLVYSKRKKNRSFALKEEAAIKKLTRKEKMELCK